MNSRDIRKSEAVSEQEMGGRSVNSARKERLLRSQTCSAYQCCVSSCTRMEGAQACRAPPRTFASLQQEASMLGTPSDIIHDCQVERATLTALIVALTSPSLVTVMRRMVDGSLCRRIVEHNPSQSRSPESASRCNASTCCAGRITIWFRMGTSGTILASSSGG